MTDWASPQARPDLCRQKGARVSGSDRVTVLGAGMTGLTVAVTLAERGHPVVLKSAEASHESSSWNAAALWRPARRCPDWNYLRRALATHDRLMRLESEVSSGVRLQNLNEVCAEPSDVPWWISATLDRPFAPSSTALAGGARAHMVKVPVADSAHYLNRLEQRFLEMGGKLKRGLATSLAAETRVARSVVNCTGFGSSRLVTDPYLSLTRFVVVRCAKPRQAIGCWVEETDGRPSVHIVERDRDLLLYGPGIPGLVSTVVPPSHITDTVRRCSALVPEIQGARVLDATFALLPERPCPRVERDPLLPAVIHNYGHGSAGFTLSWGCASEVARLVETTPAPGSQRRRRGPAPSARQPHRGAPPYPAE
ncbi:FAD-dependent oxidoreductase [Streptacidiphilus sp. BW17]|uniref:FAD-dependent oxidoreductase n=1 Tax=Streptacidiphilus sp. BW17 TaxID=3156274 RepID=UPI003517DBC8